ncbi:hypothetical protein MY11210_000188, partial [Beauveria gryllotalpidicola]
MAPFPSLFGDGLPKYEYTPIAPGARTFRLAKLLPPEPSLLPGLEPTVRISLIECSAGDGDDDTAASVEYDALSYAWDVPPSVKRPSRRIIVEDGDNGGGARSRLFIHRPLELALLRFAAANNAPAAARTGGPRYELPLFIDQICIDQDDDREKAQQVALMQAIYAHARCAVIWLGPGDAASDCWFAYVRDLCGEGVLGPVMALPAASLLRIYKAVVENPPSTVLDDPVEARHRDDLRVAVFEALEGFKRIYHERGRRAPLHELVIKHNMPDDPVAAQLGIHYDSANQAAAQTRAYTEATGLFLEQGHMDVLLLNRSPKTTKGLPSWVPDSAHDLVLPLAWEDLQQPVFAAGGPRAASSAKADAAARKIAIKGGPNRPRRRHWPGDVHTERQDGRGHDQVNYEDAKLMFDEVDAFRARHLAARYPSADASTSSSSPPSRSSAAADPPRPPPWRAPFPSSTSTPPVGITPWYVDYYSATTVLRRLARYRRPRARRPVRPVETGTEWGWTVVGEAYCDGVMDGEALGVNEGEFVLVQ